MEHAKELLEVRNIIAIIIVIVFAYLALVGKLGEDQIMAVAMLVLGFFFGNKATKDQVPL